MDFSRRQSSAWTESRGQILHEGKKSVAVDAVDNEEEDEVARTLRELARMARARPRLADIYRYRYIDIRRYRETSIDRSIDVDTGCSREC
jgi:hypothetical protein